MHRDEARLYNLETATTWSYEEFFELVQVLFSTFLSLCALFERTFPNIFAPPWCLRGCAALQRKVIGSAGQVLANGDRSRSVSRRAQRAGAKSSREPFGVRLTAAGSTLNSESDFSALFVQMSVS